MLGGWTPTTTLEEGLRLTIAYFRRTLGLDAGLRSTVAMTGRKTVAASAPAAHAVAAINGPVNAPETG